MKLSTDLLRAKAQEKYDDVTVEDAGVTFRHLLRCAKPVRRKVKALIDSLDEDKQTEEQKAKAEAEDDFAAAADTYAEILSLVADDMHKAKAFLREIDTDMVLTLFEAWTDSTQPGEASS